MQPVAHLPLSFSLCETHSVSALLPQEEVSDVLLLSMEEIITAAECGQNFTADSIFACKEYVRLKGCPQTTSPRPPVIFR